jgi:hypothetical protein
MIIQMKLSKEEERKLQIIADSYKEEYGEERSIATVALNIIRVYLEDRFIPIPEEAWEEWFPGVDQTVVRKKIPGLETSHVGRGLSDKKRGMK